MQRDVSSHTPYRQPGGRWGVVRGLSVSFRAGTFLSIHQTGKLPVGRRTEEDTLLIPHSSGFHTASCSAFVGCEIGAVVYSQRFKTDGKPTCQWATCRKGFCGLELHVHLHLSIPIALPTYIYTYSTANICTG